MKKKNSFSSLILVVLLVTVGFVAGVKYTEEKIPRSIKVVTDKKEVMEVRDILEAEFDITLKNDRLIELMAIIIDEFYFESGEYLDIEELMEGAARGLISGLDDPHSIYLSTRESGEFMKELNSELEGIGAELSFGDSGLLVKNVLKDSPALKAGLMVGDYIMRVDGEDVMKMKFMEAIYNIRGPKGTEVVLTVLRAGEELDVVPVRDVINIVSVEMSYEGDIAVVEINSFDMDTADIFKGMMVEIEEKGDKVEGLVIDLRYNPGGLLNSPVKILGHFIGGKNIAVSRIDEDGEHVYRVKQQSNLPDLPVVILVNRGSASASEILAGAFQDYRRAKVVGVRTYGKGSVQEPFEFKDGTLLKLTTSRWFTPLGRSIETIGIQPDIEVKRSADDIENDVDPQLDKALELIRNNDWQPEVTEEYFTTEV